jgi:hypothetical protein
MTMTIDNSNGAVPPWLNLHALDVPNGLQATIAEAVEAARSLLADCYGHADHAQSLVARASEVVPKDLPEDVHRFMWGWLGLGELEDIYAVMATVATGPGGGTVSDEQVRVLVERYGLED